MSELTLTPRTSFRAPIAWVWTLAVLLAGLVAGAYAARDRMLSDLRSERDQVLRGYVSREEWLTWQLSESEKRDRQYLDLRTRLIELKAGR